MGKSATVMEKTFVMSSEKMFKLLKKPETKKEKDLWEKFYKIARTNGWSNGNFARQDGDFIVPEDCLNKNSCSVIYDIDLLRAVFVHGNWCLGQSWLYLGGKYPICFTQQIDGGDEWDTMRVWADGTMSGFESITMAPTAREYSDERDKYYSGSNKPRPKEGYFVAEINRLTSVKSKKEYYGN